MKKIFVYLIVFCTFFMYSVPSSSASSGQGDVLTKVEVLEDEVFTPMVNDRVVNFLIENNIDFHITDDHIIKLDQTTPELISEVNYQLEQSMNGINQSSGNVTPSASYPTAWVYMNIYDQYNSKKFKKATKVAFAAAMTSWLTGKTASPAVVSKVAAAAFASYYFVNSDVANVYYFTKYYYRELGPGKIGPTGNYMGNYEIKKTERTTKSANGTGGQLNTRVLKSTVIEPFF